VSLCSGCLRGVEIYANAYLKRADESSDPAGRRTRVVGWYLIVPRVNNDKAPLPHWAIWKVLRFRAGL
jgi:hypothetical protein